MLLANSGTSAAAPTRADARGWSVHKQVLTKPDGRALTLYAREPLPAGIVAPGPEAKALPRSGHLRWHPLRGEWVSYAGHRQGRTFLPPAQYDPLAPTVPGGPPTEVPSGPWEIAVFDNLFPAFGNPGELPRSIVPTAAASGAAEVVVFTQDATSSLGALPLPQLELLFGVWADRTRVLGAREDVQYVMPFENRGEEVGVTLQHPHGQIYAYPFVPPVPARELALMQEHWQANGTGLLARQIEAEVKDGARLLYLSDLAAAFMPACARYAYEAWIAPRRPAATFADLTEDEQGELARALKTVLLKYDGLWGAPMPYILAWHQAPTDGAPHPEAHLHAEIYPAYRMRDRLKYLAGSEIGGGAFTADTVPEERVKELQAVEVRLV